MEFAKRSGVLLGCEANGPFAANILKVRPRDLAQRSKADFVINPTMSPEARSGFEGTYGIPYCAVGPPIDREALGESVSRALTDGVVDLPEDIGDRYIIGHELTPGNLFTLYAAETFGVPLVANFQPPVGQFSLPDRHHIERVDDGGYKNIVWVEGLTHEQWLYQLSRSKGVFYLTDLPSGGRPQMWAALLGKLSIGTASGWQWNLFRETTMRYGFEDAANFQVFERRAERLRPVVESRVDLFSPETTQARLQRFLTKHGWA